MFSTAGAMSYIIPDINNSLYILRGWNLYYATKFEIECHHFVDIKKFQ